MLRLFLLLTVGLCDDNTVDTNVERLGEYYAPSSKYSQFAKNGLHVFSIFANFCPKQSSRTALFSGWHWKFGLSKVEDTSMVRDRS